MSSPPPPPHSMECSPSPTSARRRRGRPPSLSASPSSASQCRLPRAAQQEKHFPAPEFGVKDAGAEFLSSVEVSESDRPRDILLIFFRVRFSVSAAGHEQHNCGRRRCHQPTLTLGTAARACSLSHPTRLHSRPPAPTPSSALRLIAACVAQMPTHQTLARAVMPLSGPGEPAASPSNRFCVLLGPVLAMSLCRKGHRRRRRSGGPFVTETTKTFHPSGCCCRQKNKFGGRARKRSASLHREGPREHNPLSLFSQ